jgi:hypothetical protein
MTGIPRVLSILARPSGYLPDRMRTHHSLAAKHWTEWLVFALLFAAVGTFWAPTLGDSHPSPPIWETSRRI